MNFVKNYRFSLLINLFLAFIPYSICSSSSSASVQLTLKPNERIAMEKFKSVVNPHLPHEYMKQESYLVRWLNATKFQIPASSSRLSTHLKWRYDHKMDSIRSEDWSAFSRDYKYSFDGCDKEGRPVLTAYIGDWDLRGAVIGGRGSGLTRYIDYLLEDATALLRETQDKNKTRQNQQFILILDLNGFDAVRHVCGGCLQIQLHFMRTIQNQYPGFLHRIFIVNAPGVFSPIFQIMKPLFSETARRIIRVYGKGEKREWQREIKDMVGRQDFVLGSGDEDGEDIERIRKRGWFECERLQ